MLPPAGPARSSSSHRRTRGAHQRLLKRARGGSSATQTVSRKRQEVYAQETWPRLDIKPRGWLLRRVDGVGDIDEAPRAAGSVGDRGVSARRTRRKARLGRTASRTKTREQVLMRAPALVADALDAVRAPSAVSRPRS